MAIKNWTVKTKQIKKGSEGLINHFNYLLDKNRPSHSSTEIIDLNNSTGKLQAILGEEESRKEYRRSEGLRGGGVRNLATSFVMSLPNYIKQPTTDEWKEIAKITLRKLSDDLGIDRTELIKHSVVVLHKESNDKHSHLHILVSNLFDGKVFKPTSQYQGTYSMKQGFNSAVKQVLKIDNKLHVPLDENVGDMPLYEARAKKADIREKELDDRESKLKKYFDEESIKFKDLINTAKDFFSNWLDSIRSTEKNSIEITEKATIAADSILDIEEQAPEIACDLTEIAQLEEIRRGLINDDEKVTVQVNKNRDSNKKRRTRARTNQP